MRLPARFLLVFTLTVVVVVGALSWMVFRTVRLTFHRLDAEHATAIALQFRHELDRRGAEVAHRVAAIADAEATLRMAIDVSRPQPEYALYRNDALGLAATQGLDLLELVSHDGTILSSAHWPDRAGYQNAWVVEPVDWRARGAFLRREETPVGPALALVAVQRVPVGDKGLFIVGGRWLDREFLNAVALPVGMRALLYRHLNREFSAEQITDPTGPVAGAETLAPLIAAVLATPREQTQTVAWAGSPGATEVFRALPLTDPDGHVLAVLLLGSAQGAPMALERTIRQSALVVLAVALLLGLWLYGLVAVRVSRPLLQLADAARQFAAGHWASRAEVNSRGEIGELARTFNQMADELVARRRQWIQSERVAAWRELARLFTHEVKQPLFPIELTLETLRRAREHNADRFDEIFCEAIRTLQAELERLQSTLARFAELARLPAPRPCAVNVNEIVRDVVQSHHDHFSAVGRPSITPELYLDEQVRFVAADPDLLRRVLDLLVRNALDSMPAGGTLTVRTRQENGAVRIEVSDNGTGLSREECERLFTPYYTSRPYSTGLGLAIVQSIISDHGASIVVESEAGQGTTFRITFPVAQPGTVPETAAPPRAGPDRS
ncbi:MAG: HAMP domain-containing histidine kinase [Firmicutes bacterium]|nr:HAMP domain-containing histidine kinase [Bacillota bacterium]